MAFVDHYASIWEGMMKELTMFAPFFVADITYWGICFLKNFGNTFNTDVVISGSSKLKTSIFNLKIFSAKRFFTYFFVFTALKISTKYR